MDTASAPAAFPIVAIAASAGGVEAFEAFFKGLPESPGCGFVLITHLNPDRRSMLPDIVRRFTPMPVHVAREGAAVGMNEVYVLPAGALMHYGDGVLHLRKPSALRRERKPADLFFSSLARDLGDLAVGIVLSGGDGDGTLGIKAIKEHGGLTLAQTADGHAPQHPSMPNSAIASGMVDFAVPAGEMGQHIVEFAARLDDFERLMRSEREADKVRVAESAQNDISQLLRNQIGHDFSGYKSKTFMRRVQRRMQVNRLTEVDAYTELLRREPKEVTALFRDLLINVTNFFRDFESFQALKEQVIPKLFEERGADDTVRVWVPGCATGEEVYSVAILLREHMDTLTAVPRVQVFATDIDEPSLAVARSARYPEAMLDSVSPERRKRFFVPEDGSYVVTKAVRDLCIFSPHSVIRDPPFSKLDLVSCRNLLIYFGPQVQQQVIPMFHYALKPGGYLFLGTSENVSQHSDLFLPIDKKNRIFRSRDDVSVTVRMPVSLGMPRYSPLVAGGPKPLRELTGTALKHVVEAQVIERFAPAHVVVNRDGDVAYASDRTGRYLELAPGAPTRQIVALARKGLKLELRTALREAIESDRRVVREGIAVDADHDARLRTTMSIEPLGGHRGESQLYLVVFGEHAPADRDGLLADVDPSRADAIQTVERELRDTKERLQSLIEEYETALEELKSSNEELVSVNEELQSTNEELEASKEELQSVNEELQTVNAELHGKVEQLDRANSDLHNLFESTRVATIFLDRDLIIRSYTPAVSVLFNILPGDRGRPLTDLVGRIELPSLPEDVKSVITSGQIIERAIASTATGTHYLLRLAPYRDSEFRTEGVVLTFIDVTNVKQAEAHQGVLIAELNHRVKNMLAVVISIAEQTYRTTPDPLEFKQKFIQRVASMASSFELLSRENWQEMQIRDVIMQQFAGYDLDRVAAGGPDIKILPQQALSLGIVIHELVTNATRHGALAAPDGRVAIRWEQTQPSDVPQIRVLWSETGERRVAAPAVKGFGLKLIENETSYVLRGSAFVVFRDDGLDVELRFPARA